MKQMDNNDQIQINKSFGLTTDRIQSLNDCIFAFAMTLLVLGFDLPQSVTKPELAEALYRLWPQLTTYALSFIALGGLWVAHHNQYYWIKRSNRPFLWINIFFLFFIALIPFSTKMLAIYHTERLAIMVYGVNLIISFIILYIHWSYATYKERLTDDTINNHIVNLLRARIFIIAIANICGLLLAFFSVKASLAVLLSIQFLGIVPTVSIDRFIIKSVHKLDPDHLQHSPDHEEIEH